MWLAPQVLCHLSFCSGLLYYLMYVFQLYAITMALCYFIYFNLMEALFLERGEHVRLLPMTSGIL